MAATLHRWRRVPEEPIPAGRTGTPGLSAWRCEKCGATLRRARKPTRRRLKRDGLGRTCEEWLVGEVMRA